MDACNMACISRVAIHGFCNICISVYIRPRYAWPNTGIIICTCFRQFSYSLCHFLTCCILVAPYTVTFISWHWIPMVKILHSGNQITLQNFRGSKFSLSLLFVNTLLDEQHATQCLTDWLTDWLLCRMLHVTPTRGDASYREIECLVNTKVAA